MSTSLCCWPTAECILPDAPHDSDLSKDAAIRDPVYDFSWLQGKTGTEAMTVSTDGQVLWWDTRRLGQPLEDLTLREKASAAGAWAARLRLAVNKTATTAGIAKMTAQSAPLRSLGLAHTMC